MRNVEPTNGERRAPAQRPARSGFTLVELLATVAIIGLLVALLLTGVQAAREAARRMQCAANLKQVALSLSAYHASHNALPRGILNRDPLGSLWNSRPDTWAGELLPQLDSLPLYNAFDYGRSAGHSTPGPSQTVSNYQLSLTVLPFYICPSDPIGAQPILNNRCDITGRMGTRNGHGLWYACSLGPTAPTDGYCPLCSTNAVWGSSQSPSLTNPCCNGVALDARPSGMFAAGSARVTFDSVTDGLSNTLLLGETLPLETTHNGVYLPNFTTVVTNTPLNMLARPEWIRPGGLTSCRATQGDQAASGIKSRHAGGAQTAFADGSVRYLDQSIAMPLLWAMGTRRASQVDVVTVTGE
jgi:prepilin-type N-terminal cleavage/methylation domain-containing protein/prepilin-type processing-associated H-X9-DG protein